MSYVARPRTIRNAPFLSGVGQGIADLEKTGGSLNPKVDGVVTRLSGSADPWDMERQWTGREITGYTVRKTLWNKTALIKFYVDMSSTSGKLPIFSLQLALPLTDEEITNAADTYMMLLNLRRRD